MRRIVLFTAIAAALSLLAADRAREIKLQQAIDLMGTKGDLPGAIKLLEDVAKSPDRNLAARSLLYLGDCREKLGQQESRKPYERIINEFADQKEVVAEARTRLARMGGGGGTSGPGARMVWAPPRSVWYKSLLLAPSPDGRYYAFLGNVMGEDVKLMLHDLATGTDRVVAGVGDIAVAFSPDGKQLAYTGITNGLRELRIVNTDGSGVRVLLSSKDRSVSAEDWSPDGKRILVDSQAIVPRPPGGRGVQPANPAGQPPTDIAFVSVSDGSMQVVKSAQRVMAYSLSPDGNHILYSQRSEQRPIAQSFFLLSADGKTESPLLAADWGARALHWTPDGRRVIFSSEHSGAPGLWAIRVSNGKPEDEPELIRAENISPLGFARDGSLFYESFTSLEDIYIAGLDPATGRIASPPKRVNEGFVGRARGPVAWSPEGTLLALRKVNPKPATPTIVLHSVDSGKDRDFPVDRLGPGGPWFFPDGLSLMFSGPEAQTWRRLDIRTGEAQETWKMASAGPGPLGSAFSSDPRVRYGYKKAERTDCQGENCLYPLVRITVKDEQTVIAQVRATNADLLDISISPDDKQLAIVVANSDGSQSFQVVPTAGGTPREVYRGAKDFLNGGTAWTKDGKHILAFSRQSGRVALYSLPVDGGAPVVSELPMEPDGIPAVSPDGTRIVFGGRQQKDEIWVMTGLSGPAPTVR
jgi:Tol biopolymer transport system component